MDNIEVILQAVNSLSERVETRFDRMDEKFEALDDRTREVENSITKITTLGGVASAVLAFFGWEHIKPWLTALTK